MKETHKDTQDPEEQVRMTRFKRRREDFEDAFQITNDKVAASLLLLVWVKEDEEPQPLNQVVDTE